MPDDILALSPLPAPRPALRPGRRYRIGPLAPRSDRAGPTIAGGIRSGAIAGLAIATILAVPFLLVLGAGARGPRDVAMPADVPVAQVWAGSEAPATTHIADALPAEAVAGAAPAVILPAVPPRMPPRR